MDKNLVKYNGSKKLMLTVGLLTFLQSIAIIYQAIYLARAIVYMFNRTAWSAVLSCFTIFLSAFLIRHSLQWLKSRLAYQFADETATHYQSLLLQKIFELGPRFVGKQGSGSLVTLCLEGISSFRTYLELFIPRFLAVLMIPFALLIFIFSLDSTSGIVLVVVMPILIVFLILLGLVAKKQKDAKWESHQMLSRHFVDSLRGLVTLKYLGRSKQHKENIDSVSNKYRIATIRTLRVAFLSSFSLDFFSSLSVAVVAVELGLRLINGNIGFEAALAILILAPEYFMPVKDLGNDYHATMDGKQAGEKIHEVLAKEQAFNHSDGAILEDWNPNSILAVQGLSKNADDQERSIIQDISFEVRGYQKIGIIGLSGAGKSTLIDVLSGFSNISSGDIKLNGQMIPSFTIDKWQEQVTYIPQHPYIFAASIRENIAWYEPESTIEKIEEALCVAGLEPLVASLPNGLEEKIGQGGRVLSGGEEQRIALARAFLADKPILLFDEPTAHLDIETEHEMKQFILPLLDNKLVFFATHRLHWMKDMDQILVLDHGRLVESGNEKELFEKQGAYYRLVETHRGGKAYETV